MSGLPRKKCTPKCASSNRAEHKTVQTRQFAVYRDTYNKRFSFEIRKQAIGAQRARVFSCLEMSPLGILAVVDYETLTVALDRH